MEEEVPAAEVEPVVEEEIAAEEEVLPAELEPVVEKEVPPEALEPVVEEEVTAEEEVPPAPLEPVVDEEVPAEEEEPSLNNNVNEFKSDDIEDELPDELKKNLFKPVQESKAPISPRPPIRPRFSPPPYNRQNSTIHNTSNHVEENKTLIRLRQFRSNIVSTWRYVKEALTHNPTK